MADLKPRIGKPPLGLLPRAGLEAAASAMEHGAGKYWPNNWQDCPPDEAFTYVHAMLRHALAIAAGEEIDPESGVPHAAHLAAGAMIYCHIRGLGYVEPNVMREHPDRKARLNSMAAMFGPRPAHPADVKSAGPDAYSGPWSLPDPWYWARTDGIWYARTIDGDAVMWDPIYGSVCDFAGGRAPASLEKLVRERNTAPDVLEAKVKL